MNWSDVYGEASSPFQQSAPITPGGPGQSFVSPAFSGAGTATLGSGPGPAISLVGLAVALALLRVAIELSGEA